MLFFLLQKSQFDDIHCFGLCLDQKQFFLIKKFRIFNQIMLERSISYSHTQMAKSFGPKQTYYKLIVIGIMNRFLDTLLNDLNFAKSNTHTHCFFLQFAKSECLNVSKLV